MVCIDLENIIKYQPGWIFIVFFLIITNAIFFCFDPVTLNIYVNRPSLVVNSGQLYRLLTAPWIHFGELHLFVDVILILVQIIFFSLNRSVRFHCILFIVSTVSGSVCAIFVAYLLNNENTLNIAGSSDFLFGLLSYSCFEIYRRSGLFLAVWSFIALVAYIVIDLYLGHPPFMESMSTFGYGHIGGAVGGILIGFIDNYFLHKTSRGKE